LFLTTSIATAAFLGTSQLLPLLIPPAAAAFTASPEAANDGFQLIIVLAQIGLFALWFAFILFSIYFYVRPVRRIDKYLQKIVEGEHVRKVRIGKAKQYRVIEEKLEIISHENNERLEKAYEQRMRAKQRREEAARYGDACPY